MTKVIVVDDERCLACRQCMIECAMAYSDTSGLAEAVRSHDPPQARVYVESGEHYGIPLQCRHCQDAPCISICPTEAMHRDSHTGPVLLDEDRCIGCSFCIMVCPFGVIDLRRDGKAVVKCDQCIQRTEAGQEPACVAGCPTGALRFVEMDKWLRERRRQAAGRVAAGQTAMDKENAI